MRFFGYLLGFLLVVLYVEAKKGKASLDAVTNKVFFDIEVDGQPSGRIVMGLFGKCIS